MKKIVVILIMCVMLVSAFSFFGCQKASEEVEISSFKYGFIQTDSSVETLSDFEESDIKSEAIFNLDSVYFLVMDFDIVSKFDNNNNGKNILDVKISANSQELDFWFNPVGIDDKPDNADKQEIIVSATIPLAKNEKYHHIIVIKLVPKQANCNLKINFSSNDVTLVGELLNGLTIKFGEPSEKIVVE